MTWTPSGSLTLPSPVGLTAVREALSARHHRRATILSIGDSWAEPTGQTAFDLCIPSQFARCLAPARTGVYMRARYADGVPWQSTAISYTGTPSEFIYPAAPGAREFGGDAYLTLVTAPSRWTWAELCWWRYEHNGQPLYGDGIQWRPRGETEWRTITDAQAWTMGEDGAGGTFKMGRVWIKDASGVEVKANAGGFDAGAGRVCFSGAMFLGDETDFGIDVVNFAISGTDSSWWAAHVPTAGSENTVARGLDPDVLHISLTGNDVAAEIPIETYKANLTALVAHYRGLVGRDLPVIFTTQSLPDITHPQLATDASVWNAYRTASREAIESVGGWWCDVATALGPMSQLSAPTRYGRRDYGARIDDTHLSNLGAGHAAQYMANLVLTD